jgi:hypothetical protein
MTDAEALGLLSRECPRRIVGHLHARGQYLHCTCGRFPGKVLCFHCDSDVPDDCELTDAQAHFFELQEAGAQATG